MVSRTSPGRPPDHLKSTTRWSPGGLKRGCSRGEVRVQNTKNMYGILVEYEWNMHRACVNKYVWNMHRISMECIWNIHGVWLEHAWTMHGICGYMQGACAWDMHGICTEHAWNMHGICLEHAQHMHEMCMEYVSHPSTTKDCWQSKGPRKEQKDLTNA